MYHMLNWLDKTNIQQLLKANKLMFLKSVSNLISGNFIFPFNHINSLLTPTCKVIKVSEQNVHLSSLKIRALNLDQLSLAKIDLF